MQILAGRDYAGLNRHQCKILYGPIVLEYALIQSCEPTRQQPKDQTSAPPNSLGSGQELFQSLANKLAQVCDNERGGSTVTAITILNGPDGPNYVLAANRKEQEEMEATKSFIKTLVDLVGLNPDKLNAGPLQKKVLWTILSFNISRVEVYRANLASSLEACLESYSRHDDDDADLERELKDLKQKCNFPIDVMQDQEETKCISDCETLIKAVRALENSDVEAAIWSRGQDGEITRSEPWCELRHYIGRWRSFRQAAEVIAGAATRWPLLFQNVEVTMIPSSNKMCKPIPKSNLTAVDIVEEMVHEDKTLESTIKQHAQDMQRFGLDEKIQEQVAKAKFRPIVHAEVLIHDYLLKQNITHPSKFWKHWQYIGTSKPTCRLCHYYFTSHTARIEVRRPHYNLYPNWRLPDAPDKDEEEGWNAHDKLLGRIAQKMRDDVRKTLEDRTTGGKTHDSNTHSVTPTYLVSRREELSQDESAAQASSESLVDTDEEVASASETE
ncbi:hypothetical protein FZEAL_2164 [Fusarium zealandicum]|uniref:Uncharacterized protein n=1 Tax=Fusarium zealandicum TaxID=1053134 RepID=A0A8H4US00_9HYPO|nr:hypothetical protein FZEAL_2164 [Fusarium zealandicum]